MNNKMRVKKRDIYLGRQYAENKMGLELDGREETGADTDHRLGRLLRVFPCSVLKGEGIEEAFGWFAGQI